MLKQTLSRRLFLQTAAAAVLLTACGKRQKTLPETLPEHLTVLALGDSLTAGYGAVAGADFPTQLAQLSGWNVINGGVSGDTSAQALKRLPALLKKEQPDWVLVGIGGNDFLRRVPESETRANIAKILETVQADGKKVVLIAEPYVTVGALFGSLSDHPMYEELGKEFHVPVFAGGWAEILEDDSLKSDQIHANAAGYRKFAENLWAFLQEQGNQ